MPKHKKKSQERKRLNNEGRYLRTQVESNANNRRLAFNNLDEGYETIFKKQMLKSCACRKHASVKDMKLQGSYSCKYRFCIACLRYFAVKQRFFYAPAISKIHEKHVRDPKHNAALWFVTLTKPIAKFDELPKTLDLINERWRAIYKNAKERKLSNFSGVRKIEITANPIKGLKKGEIKGKEQFTYHAHLHLLVHGRSNALFLREKWLEKWNEANFAAQNIKKFNGNVAEMLKYVIKLTHGADSIMSQNYAQAIGWVYNCLQRRRVFFTFGAIKKCTEEELQAWKDEHPVDERELLDESIGEESQSIRSDKTWANGLSFFYDKKLRNFVEVNFNILESKRLLVDKQDFDIDDPTHFCQAKKVAIEKFDDSDESDKQSSKIEEELDEIEREIEFKKQYEHELSFWKRGKED